MSSDTKDANTGSRAAGLHRAGVVGGSSHTIWRSRRFRRSRQISALLIFIVPAAVLVGALVAYPVYTIIMLSLHRSSTFLVSGSPFIGFANYRQFFHDPLAGSVVAHTFLRGIGGVIPSYLLGLGAALALKRRMRFGSTLRILALLPFVISPPVGLNMWLLILNPDTGVGASLGVHIPDLFSNTTLVWPTLLAINTWGSFAYYLIILLAGLQAIPPELYEAASADGASAWQRFRHITLPGLLPVSAVAITLHFILSFEEFNLIYITTAGGPLNATQTMPVYAYQLAFGGTYEMGYASAIVLASVILMLATIALVGMLWWLGRRVSDRRRAAEADSVLSYITQRGASGPDDALIAGKHKEESPEGRKGRFASKPRRPSRPLIRSSGRRRNGLAVRYFFAILIALVAVAPMLFVISQSLTGKVGRNIPVIPTHPTLGNYSKVLTNPDLTRPSVPTVPPLALNVVNSLIVTAAVTALVVGTGALAGYGISRITRRTSAWLMSVFGTAQLIPIIMLVFPLYELLAQVHLLNTQIGQIFATSVLFIPMSVLFFKVFFDRVPREFEEAAAIDGAGRLRIFIRVVLPMSKPAIGAIGAFAIINTWNEFLLAVTLVSGNSQRTLPPALEELMSTNQFAAANTPGMQAVYIVIPIAAALALLALTQRHIMTAYQAGGIK